MRYDDAPKEVPIADVLCCKYNNCGNALYKLYQWPFYISIAAGATMWRWSVEGLGTSKRGAVNYSGSYNESLHEAVRQAEIACGDFVRQLLHFQNYKDYEDR